MKFKKYNALGNSYLVIEEKDLDMDLSKEAISILCSKNFGIGSDGILLKLMDPVSSGFRMRIFNPDGSEAEKSGNGIRIFCRYLFDNGLVNSERFTVLTKGGTVNCQIMDCGSRVNVEMGTAIFDVELIPVSNVAGEALNQELVINDEKIAFSSVSMGNPHCVVFVDHPSKELAYRLGPKIEEHSIFPNRTNVQFVKVIGSNLIQIEIWERGAGYTLASGSSSCAAAAVAKKLGYCDSEIVVRMPGGEIEIKIDENYVVTMEGPVTSVCSGTISSEALLQCL
ncbi:diaminopimelate epimerase [Microbulbifer sp. SH-1]|uniref:diaminopimelate epimerase n=1 Tax=Microbulbifer sp. SH-1 TaxID=2681547 RepID=UPI00140E752E|nr:diaminopimelate epimerase [Microbulbifer sp. SH-1]QIL91399.1 diaminopimelate epimerase [Microbulbifer sp. SH-1]